MDYKENGIEWLTGQDRVTFSFSQKKYINKVKNLAKTHENEVDFVENEDGSITGHLPLKAVKLSIIHPKNGGFFGKGKDDEESD